MVKVLLVCLACLSVAGCLGSGPRNLCRTDDDCRGARVCVEGVCADHRPDAGGLSSTGTDDAPPPTDAGSSNEASGDPADAGPGPATAMDAAEQGTTALDSGGRGSDTDAGEQEAGTGDAAAPDDPLSCASAAAEGCGKCFEFDFVVDGCDGWHLPAPEWLCDVGHAGLMANETASGGHVWSRSPELDLTDCSEVELTLDHTFNVREEITAGGIVQIGAAGHAVKSGATIVEYDDDTARVRDAEVLRHPAEVGAGLPADIVEITLGIGVQNPALLVGPRYEWHVRRLRILAR